MIQYFDSNSQYEIPEYVLCNPNGDKLFALGGIYDRQLNLRYNAVSTIRFAAPKNIDGIDMPYYPYLVGKRRVYIVDIGMFIITKVIEKSDGAKTYKEVEAKSLEFELSFRRIINLTGTWKFYDDLDTSKSLMHKILTYIPGWSLGTIDTSLRDLYRTFNEKDTTAYTFLMKEMEQAYQCIFTFDTINKTISAYSLSNAITETNIYLSYSNLLKNVDIDENSDEIVTALSVYGKDDLSINQVNPLGNDIIYNFDYFANTQWMSQDLITSINNWKDVINEHALTYANTLTSWMAKNVQLNELNNAIRTPPEGVPDPIATGLYALETYLLEVQNSLKLAIDSGQEDLTEEQAAVAQAEEFIAQKTATIEALQAEMDALNADLIYINNLCKIEANFTQSQLDQLNNFIFAGSYDNRNFLQTSEMTLEQIQQMALDLYAQGVIISNKVSQPIYEFTLAAHNFIFIEYFKPFIDQLSFGSSIYVQLDEESQQTLFVPIILGCDYNYDDPTAFQLLLSNRMRLANSEIELADISSDADRTISQVKFNAGEWSDWIRNGQQTVNQYIDEALNNSLETLIATKDQEIIINNNGLIGRQKDGASYKPNQIWLTSNQIAFTNNNWQTVKMAVGQTKFGEQDVYGVVGDAIVGRIIAGNNLIIENNVNSQLSTFRVDGDGVELRNLDLILTSNSQNARVTMNPSTPMLVEKKVGASFLETLRINSDGNLTMNGAVTATSGKIGNWNIDANGLYSDDNSNYIKPNSVKIGGMSYTRTAGGVETTTFNGGGTFSGTLQAASGTFIGTLQAASGSFNGEVTATRLTGSIDWANIVNAPSFASYFNGQSGYGFGGFSGFLPPSKLDYGLWNFGSGSIGREADNVTRMRTLGITEILSGGGLSIFANAVTMGDVVNLPYYTWLDSGTKSLVLNQSRGDARYAAISHSHTQYYESGDSPSFGVVYANRFQLGGGNYGYNGSISVDRYGTSGGYGLTFYYGILTGVSNI